MGPLKPWTGYFVQSGKQSEMAINKFRIEQEGKIEGEGTDECGDFTFQGFVTMSGAFPFQAVKHYATWDIHYFGNSNETLTELKGHWGWAENTP